MNEPDFSIPLFKIQTDNVKPPFDQIIRAIQNSEVHGPRPLHETEMFVMKHCVNGWDTSLHWAVKLKWDKKLKIPGGQAHARATKPLGLVLFREMDLCIQCHFGVGYKRAGYLDASIWFGELWKEHLRSELNDLLNLTVNGGGKKAGVLNLRQNVIALLKEDQNPFNPAVEPCLHHLIECSLYLAGKSSNFRDDCWLPYIRSLSAWATALDSNSNGYYQVLICRVVRKKERMFLQICKPLGKGKGQRVLFEKEVAPKTLTA